MEKKDSNQVDNNQEQRNVKIGNEESQKASESTRNKIFYADSKEVNRIDHRDNYDYLNMSQGEQKKQSMKGFDDDYNNIVDYIVKITRQIWKEKDIGLIYDTYSTDIQIHKGRINSHGVNEVISGTLQTLQAFPDRKGSGWSVIWSGNDEDGFFTSHRGRSIATNTGDSFYGPATGKKVMFRTTADCLIHSNKIYEEWLVMDTYHLVQQLGYDPIEVAKIMAKSTKKLAPPMNFGLSETAEVGLPPEVYVPKHKDFEIGDFVLQVFNRIWERRSINYIKKFYEDNATVHFICNRDLVGFNEIQGMFISFFASLPNAKVLVDRVTCNKRDTDREYDVAVRWRIQGIHEGTGYFGTPSGKPIEITGINHFKIKDEKITEEWFLFDGMEVLRQIHTEKDNEEGQDGQEEVENTTEDGNFTGVS
ncbi:ester cyclase [Halobacillus naozhouensis]|uniref:Ester cyclase n=1 Tax=Halobacillus naozhouensis TaxID=554880 RepID=A0ABY8J201_9BACI|nr:ester cyclase [Halobacillus naozhouensis]WFT75574.1 ester cyclase [Halobacillus naozhouensis]